MVNIFQNDIEYISNGILTDWNTFQVPLGRYILRGYTKYSQEQFLQKVACTIRILHLNIYLLISTSIYPVMPLYAYTVEIEILYIQKVLF